MAERPLGKFWGQDHGGHNASPSGSDSLFTRRGALLADAKAGDAKMTPSATALLAHLTDLFRQGRPMPTVRAIASAFGWSQASAHGVLEELRSAGHVGRDEYRRLVLLTRPPACRHCGGTGIASEGATPPPTPSEAPDEPTRS